MNRLKKTIFGFCVFLLAFSVVLIPFSAKTKNKDSRFGINAFVLNRYQWQEWDRPIELLEELKVSWTREEFVWSLIEPEQNQFNWGFYDAAIEELTKSDINILGIIDYSAPWATDDPDREFADKYMPDMELWRRYVGMVVDRYGDHVKYWQIWNEPNIVTFFRPAPNVGQYMEILQNASEVIREKDSDAVIVLGGTSGVDIGYLRELNRLGAGRYFDILAVHPYRLDFYSPPEQNGLMRDLDLAETIAEEFGNKPIWLTEFGWPTDNTEGISEELQADYLVRSYLLSFTFPNIKKLFWYDFRNDGDNRDYREHNFGIVARDYSKKKSFYAYKNLIDLLEYSEFEKALSSGENGIYDFVFKKGRTNVRVIWKVEGVWGIPLDILGADKIYNIEGEELFSNGLSRRPLVINIDQSPIFVISSGEEEAQEGYYDYGYVDQSSYLDIEKDERVQLWLKLKNTGTATWENFGNHPVLLGTCRSNDRESQFFVKNNWIGSNRPTKLKENEVAPGETGTFEFLINPGDLDEGRYQEYFCPVVENLAWMKDMGIYWEIDVLDNKEEVVSESWSIEDYDYEVVEQSPYPVLEKGKKDWEYFEEGQDPWSRMSLTVKNTGKATWYSSGDSPTRLGTSRGKDRIPMFGFSKILERDCIGDNGDLVGCGYEGSTWVSDNRVSMNKEVVRPGEEATFEITYRAYDNLSLGRHREYFQPVVDGLGWMKDVGIYWDITVK